MMQRAMVNLVRLMNHDEKCDTKTRLLLDSGGAEDESEAN